MIIFIVNSCSVNSEKAQSTVSEQTFGNNDPIESANRAIFAFNEDLDDYIFKPVARGWRKIPDFPRNNLTKIQCPSENDVHNYPKNRPELYFSTYQVFEVARMT